MKKSLLKSIAISLFALSMAFGASSLFAHAKVNGGAETVLAEGEETPETGETASEEGEETPSQASEEEQPTEESEETPKEEQPTEDSAKPAETSKPTGQDFLSAFIQTFKDAWADLVAHFKRWFSK